MRRTPAACRLTGGRGDGIIDLSIGGLSVSRCYYGFFGYASVVAGHAAANWPL